MFDCSKVVPKKCHGDCCRFVPIPKSLWEDQKKNVVRKVLFVYQHDENNVMPITKDLHCPFLNEDYSCNIYNVRPWVCRLYGKGGHDCLSCPYLKPNGNKRDSKERDRLLKQNNDDLSRVAGNINKIGKMLGQGATLEDIKKEFPVPKQDRAESKIIMEAIKKVGQI